MQSMNKGSAVIQTTIKIFIDEIKMSLTIDVEQSLEYAQTSSTQKEESARNSFYALVQANAERNYTSLTRMAMS